MTASGRPRSRLAGTLLAVALICGLSGCTPPNRTPTSPYTGKQAGVRAFVEVMAEHNRIAIGLAEVAEQRGQHVETRSLATRMVSARALEDQGLSPLLGRLSPEDGRGDPRPPVDLTPTSLTLAKLGVPAGVLGLPPPPGFSVRAGPLDLADPFDRSFIDVAVALNRGAIALAEAGLRVADDEQAERLARSIIRTRVCEIQALNDWRRRWHGLRSPAGGVPATARLALPGELKCS